MKEFMDNLLSIKCPICGREIHAVWMEDYKNIYGCIYCHTDITIEMDKKFEEDFKAGCDKMYCGCCGTDDNKIITQNVEQDGNTVTFSYFGVCKNCGEPLGIKEFYSLTDWDYIDSKIVKETLLSFKGKGKFIKR